MGLFSPKTKRRPVKQSDVARGYQKRPPITEQLPWCDFSDEHNIMLLEDGCSMGIGFIVDSLPCEHMDEAALAKLQQNIVGIFSEGVPKEAVNPWVMQLYVQDELSLQPLYERLETYIDERVGKDDPLAREYLAQYKEHFALMSRDEGMFIDPMNNLPFRGKFRRFRILLYRRLTDSEKKKPSHNPVRVLLQLGEDFRKRLQENEFKVKYLRGRDYYEWFVRWFNPHPALTDGNVDALLEKFPYPARDKPFGWSFSTNTVFSYPDTTDGDGWVFDNLKHRVLLFKELQQAIPMGAITMERTQSGKQKYALFDKLPVGSIYTMQVVFEPKNQTENHLGLIRKAAVGADEHIDTIRDNLRRAKREMNVNHNMLFRSTEALFIRGENSDALDAIEGTVSTLIANSGLRIHKSEHEVYPLDAYVRLLPFNYCPKFDKEKSQYSTYKYATDMAKLFPGFGRTKGDGQNPLFLLWNRGGEPFIGDPLNKAFKGSNSHMFIGGITGAGKSVALNSIAIAMQATYRPCMFIAEVGGSLDYTVRYCGHHGRSVRQIKYDNVDPVASRNIVPMNPFREGYRALAQIEKINANFTSVDESEAALSGKIKVVHDAMAGRQKIADDKERSEEADRDILNEMLLAFTTLITQGNLKAKNELSLDDMTAMTRALIYSLQRARRLQKPQMIITDLRDGCLELNVNEKKAGNQQIAERYFNYAQRLERYITDPVRAKCINRVSEPLSEVDVTHIDFGFMQDPTYTDLMNIVCIAFLSQVLAIAEKNKATKKPTILMLDEAHVFFKSDVVAVFVVLMAKVGRKLGMWLIPTTQNIEDFDSVESRKALSMMETWLMLTVTTNEIKLIEEFKPLTDREKDMINDIRKYPGIYSEGVLLGKNYQGLFRNVPPRLHLALSMTEQDERAARAALQREKQIDEVAASHLMAEAMKKKAVVSSAEDTFL